MRDSSGGFSSFFPCKLTTALLPFFPSFLFSFFSENHLKLHKYALSWWRVYTKHLHEFPFYFSSPHSFSFASLENGFLRGLLRTREPIRLTVLTLGILFKFSIAWWLKRENQEGKGLFKLFVLYSCKITLFYSLRIR